MILDYQRLLHHRIDQRHADLSRSIADGAATDFADYRERVGKARGLLEARQLVDDALKELRADDDD